MSYSNYTYDVYPGPIPNAGSYANLAYYNGPFPAGYMPNPPKEAMGQTAVPVFGSYGYSSVSRGITIPGNYLTLRQAYSSNSANGCSMFASNGMP